MSLAWDAMNISIHAPREGGDIDIDDLQECMDISIHAPREGGDDVYAQIMAKLNISIHAPREGGDSNLLVALLYPNYFNPRPPRGGRRYI